MKHVVMSVLMFAITSCAVEPAPASTSTTTDDETSVDQTTADPHASICEQPFGVCESSAMCTANGGRVVGVCTGNQGICCHFF